MTVNAPSSKDFGKYYTANGSNTTFAFDFPVGAEDELIVEVDNVVQSSGYSLSSTPPIGESGANVVFVSAPANNAVVAIYRDTTNDQGANIGGSTTFNEQEFEDVFDQIVRKQQDLERLLEKCFRVKNGSSGSAPGFPSIAGSDEGKVLVVDENGDFELSTTNLGNLDTQVAAAAASANAAAASATSAGNSSTTAGGHASTAEGHKNTATTKANEASASATLSQKWANEDEDTVVSGGEYSSKHYSIKSQDSADQAVVTANNLAATLTGNYIYRSNPSVDGNNEFVVTKGGQYGMEANDVAVLPDSGVDISFQAVLFNATNGTWVTKGCKIKSSTISINGLGTGEHDINHEDEGDLLITYNPGGNYYELQLLGSKGEV